MKRVLLVSVVAFLAACGGTNNNNNNGIGSATVTGTVDGTTPFDVVSAVWIGLPDDPEATLLFLTTAEITCDDVAAPGWDEGLGDMQILEFDIAGTEAGTYPVDTDAALDHSYIVGGVATDEEASAGEVVITSTDNDTLVGTFSGTWAAGTLSGSFEAAYCANGVEP